MSTLKKELLFIAAFCFLLSTLSFAQKKETLLARADKYYKNKEYVLAIENFEKVNSLDVVARFKLGMCYQQTNKYRKALNAYQGLLNKKWEGSDYVYLNYGLMAKCLGLYGKAGNAFEKYLFNNADDEDVRDLFLSCQSDYLTALQKNKHAYKIDNLVFNSEFKDMNPLVFFDGLIFSSSRRDHVKNNIHNRDGEQFLDLHYVEKNDLGVYEESEILHTQVLRDFHVGQSVLDTLTNKMYMTVNIPNQNIRDENNQAIHHLQIDESIYNPETHEFTKPSPININNPNYSVGHPTLLNYGQTMIFASDKPGGYGGVDLYKSEIQDNGSWSEPENLGDIINTSGNDMFPYVYDENTLYFSSDRHIGLGGLDIFKAVLKEGEIISIENLGAPINSPTDDFGITFIPEKKSKGYIEGFFTSNRFGGRGSDDIYHFKSRPSDFIVFVIDSITRKPIENVIVECYDKQYMAIHQFITDETGYVKFNSREKQELLSVAAMSQIYKYKEVPVGSIKKTNNIIIIELVKGQNLQLVGDVLNAHTNERIMNSEVFLFDNDSTRIRSIGQTEGGHYSMILTKLPDDNYLIGSADEYGTANVKITNPTPDRYGIIYQDIYLRPNSKQNIVNIENIYYPFDSPRLTSDAKMTLNEVYDYLDQNQNLRAELHAHCDIRGTEGYNMQLSLRRVESAMNYLVQRGIHKDRLVLGYFGEDDTAIDCIECTEYQHQKNRRTEIRILK
ncbi:OmpA family protein [Flammeovirga pacifica]|nr:OmpA family protein [Flammeovirga pacifica]